MDESSEWAVASLAIENVKEKKRNSMKLSASKLRSYEWYLDGANEAAEVDVFIKKKDTFCPRVLKKKKKKVTKIKW